MADKLRQLIEAITAHDEARVRSMLSKDPTLATLTIQIGATRQESKEHFFESILHYVLSGDTALHMAGAAHWPEVVARLLSLNADPNARNRRGGTPLHYATDGGPGLNGWKPRNQAAVIAALVKAGGDVHALDKGGVAPLHRAVRNRCALAVEQLLTCGADPAMKNKSGSTPLSLAQIPSGRGHSGSPEAQEQQQLIVGLLRKAL